MNLKSFQFPLEGNVQSLVHFIDTRGAYAFTFGSPFCYMEPNELKEKKAFLIGAFNQLKKKNLNAESIFTYYTNSEEKTQHSRAKASVRESKIFRGDGTPLGTIQILLQRGIFRTYAGTHPNPIYDSSGTLIGFCHFNSKQRSKDVYSCDPDFPNINDELTDERIKEYISQGIIKHIFSYDIVESEEVDNKDRFMAIFSPSKKSELTNNRFRYICTETDEQREELFLTALFAFFWGTYVDIPLN